MKRADIRILLVEDDTTLGRAMHESLRRAGFQVEWVPEAESALKAFRISPFHLAIIDCMIPKVSGLDLGCQLRELAGDNLKILLTSGIYKDPSFVKNAIFKTRANGFLHKPFEIEDLIKEVEKGFEGQVESERDILFALLTENPARPAELAQRFAELESVHGFELIMIYSILMRSKVTGRLKLTDANGAPSSIHFHNGKVVQVELTDTESYFGVLLVEKGFTTVEEVEAGLAMPSPKRIGERLVDANFLSPHAINIVQTEQVAIRLSKAIHETSYSLQLDLGEVPSSPAFIDNIHLTPLLNDWILSKVTPDHLQSFYLAWMDSLVEPGPEYSRAHMLRHLPILEMAPNLLEALGKPLTLRQWIDASDEAEPTTLAAIHFLFLTGVARAIASVRDDFDFDNQMRHLERLRQEAENKNHFEILGLSNSARASEINRAYHDLAKVLHPDRLSPKAPPELHKLRTEVFGRISEAYDVLKDGTRRQDYLRSLELGRAEEALANEQHFEVAVDFLLKGRVKEGYQGLKALKDKKPRRPDFAVYFAWALLKGGSKSHSPHDVLDAVEKHLHTVPPEERHTPHYFFTRGLFHKVSGNYRKALQYFRHAASMDREFLEARREFVTLYNRFKDDNPRTFVSDMTVLFKKAK